jgi:integrase
MPREQNATLTAAKSTPNRSPARADIELAGGYDPYELVPQLWDLLAAGNNEPRLFLTDAGPVRLEIVDGLPMLTDLTADRLTQEAHRVARFIVTQKNGIRLCSCPHLLRHTFCSHLAMRGAPARAIQELAGHRDIGTTQRYMHLSPATLDAAIRLLDPPPVLQRGDTGEAATQA